MKSDRTTLVFILFALFMVLLQLPFLCADPDSGIDGGRGPFTDEGLNTCQIRNYIHHQDISFDKSDNLIKTPLFSAILYSPFKIFGSARMTGRLSILLITVIILSYLLSYNLYYTIFGIIFIMLVYLEFYVFHYAHFCLAEILSTVLIWLALFFLVEATDHKKWIWSGFLAATSVTFSYFIKVQFIYAVLIIPLSTLIFLWVDKAERKTWLRLLSSAGFFLIIYLIIYYVAWYLPNREFYNYVMADQTNDRFVSLSNLTTHLHYVFLGYFHNGYLWLFSYSFYVLYLLGAISLFTFSSRRFRIWFIALSTWLVLELHKIPMTYQPSRYMLSLFFVMGLTMTLVIHEYLHRESKSRPTLWLKIAFILLFLTLGIKNSWDYYKSFQKRTYAISEMDNYLGKYNFKDCPVIGAWAPSLTWKSGAKSFPVWKDYFNDKDVFSQYNPAIIISETDEEDSNSAYSSRGIRLDDYADSIRYFKINKWNIKLLWLKPIYRKGERIIPRQ